MRVSMLLVAVSMGCIARPSDSGEVIDLGTVSWDETDQILVLSCGVSSCHGSGAGGLTIDGDGDHDALVGVASSSAPGETLVIAYDADSSYLIKKMEGASGIVGGAMPPTGMLDETTVAKLRSWIDAGAPAGQ